MTAPTPLSHPMLDLPNIRHGFFTREGGVSGGIYEGLNVGLGSNDTKDSIVENRRLVADTMGLPHSNLATVHQVHSPDVVTLEHAGQIHDRPKADALVTRLPNIGLGVLTADCGPVLFADGKNQVVGAAHAGWKGATTGVLENTVIAMEALGAERPDICAVLGPTISSSSYEVGPEFVDRLKQLHSRNERYLSASQNDAHAMFDLATYIVDRLNNVGVNAYSLGNCTYLEESRFYSYRRTTHRGETDYGRQISIITMDR